MASPGFYFYTGDWQKKTRVLTLQAKGAWIDMLTTMNDAKPRGVLAWSVDQFARFLAVNCETACGILLELELTGVADVHPTLRGAHFMTQSDASNAIITVVSRRMTREEKDKESSKLRQSRYRRNAKVTASVTEKYKPSSISSSISSSLNLNSEENKNSLLPGDVSQERSRTVTTQVWPDGSLWLKEFLETTGFRLVPTPNGTLFDPRWWDSVSETCGGLSLPFLTTEFNRISAWLNENPSRSPATPRGWKKFIRHWLEKAHDFERRRAYANTRQQSGR